MSLFFRWLLIYLQVFSIPLEHRSHMSGRGRHSKRSALSPSLKLKLWLLLSTSFGPGHRRSSSFFGDIEFIKIFTE